MFRKTWFIATVVLATIGLAIGSVVYVGTVLQPQWEKERIHAADLKACDIFAAAVVEADQQETIERAFDKIFRGVNKALEVYDPSGTSRVESFGPAYDEFLRLGQMEYAITSLGEDAFSTVGSEIQVIAEGCNALRATATPTPSATN